MLPCLNLFSARLFCNGIDHGEASEEHLSIGLGNLRYVWRKVCYNTIALVYFTSLALILPEVSHHFLHLSYQYTEVCFFCFLGFFFPV